MSRHDKDTLRSVSAGGARRPGMLLFCGALGVLGNLAPLGTLIVAAVLTPHDFIADTVSDLGRGSQKWIMDTGFYLNAGGLLALSIGAAHAHIGRVGWSIGVFCLAFTALVVVLLGLWDEFGTGDDLSVHTRLTFFLGPLYLAGPLLMASGAATLSRGVARAFIASAGLWLVLAAGFKLAPDAWDGIVEKAAIAATLLWTLPLAGLQIAQGRALATRPAG